MYIGEKYQEKRMKRINHILNVVLAGCLVLGAFAALPTKAAQAAGTEDRGTSPAAFLNGDGSLNLDGSFNGSFDLEGWDVNLDPALGPVFSPLAAEGDWSEMGGSTSPINGPVFSILVNGSDVYVGGQFQNAAGIDEADN